MSENWINLTQNRDTAQCRYGSVLEHPYVLRWRSHYFQLTSAEALAFALQLPEVRALVEALQGMLHFARSFDMGGDWEQGNYPAIQAARAALAPFEEATDD